MENLYSNKVNAAYKLHTEGKYEEAKKAYEALIAENPSDFDVKNLYAQLLFSLKEYDKSLHVFYEVLEKYSLDSVKINIAKVYFTINKNEDVIKVLDDVKAESPEILRLKALAFFKNQDYKNSEILFQKLISLNSASYDDIYNFSICLGKLKDTKKAIQYAEILRKNNPDDISLNLHLASLYESMEDIDKTIEILEYISTIKQDVDILNRIGILYKKNGNFEKAIEYFNYIIEIDSQNVDAWLQKAIIFKHFDKKTALEIFEHLENIDPSNNMITFNKYLLLLEMYKYNEALETAFKMLESEPENYFYYCLCAEIYLGLEQYDKSAEYYEKSFKYSPLNQMAMVGLAGIYSIKGDFQKAKNLIESIPEENKSGSDDPEYMYYYIHMRNKQFDEVKETFFKNHLKIKNTKEKDEQARGLFYKLDIGGNYNISEEGFAIFRKNLNEESDLFYKNCMKKRWKDEDITGKTLLLYSINGAGDIIMFSRYINDIKDKAGKIIMLLPESFKELYKTSFKDIEIHTDYKEINLDEIDYTSSYMLLLYTAKADLKNIKYSQGYLTVSENSVKEKSKYDFINTNNPILPANKKKIGIFWQGNPSILQNRSIKLKYFIPIVELDNVQLYSFQISNVDFESDRLKNELKIIDLAPYIKSYNDTAAFLKNMDLLITIDTSIANLAGALGIPTYLLLPYATEWRWFYDTDSTPWYDSIKIFKQKKPNDWEEVITRVKNGLRL